MSALARPLEIYLRSVANHVLDLARRGRGMDILGAVPGRPPAEDVEIEVDRVCQGLLEQWCQETGIEMEIYSEHGTIRSTGNPVSKASFHGMAPLRYLVAADPFDGSGLFQRGLAAEWWSVLSIYDIDTLAPVCGGAVDILRREIYLAEGDMVTLVSLETGGRVPLRVPNKPGLDGQTVIAAYMMDPSYLSDWIRNAGPLLAALVDRFPSVRLWPNGGSCIYPWLARGLVHAYVMFNEPRSEIDPGVAFARAAGFPLFSVQQDGVLKPYEFIPGRQSERVPFFIAACTQGLSEEIVKEILQGG